MRRTLNALAAITVLLNLPVPAPAKGDTVRIVIIGADLSVPIEITEPRVMGRFNVWTSSVNADLSKGFVPPPKHLQVYEVSFVTTRSNPGSYIVRYAIDTTSNEGFVYLPGKGDPEYRSNVWLISRGVEGNWFHARAEWEALARPLIQSARKAQQPVAGPNGK